MKILVNGEERSLADDYTLAHLVEEMGLSQRRIAVEINQQIIPRSGYADYSLQSGDRVEVVTAIGGG